LQQQQKQQYEQTQKHDETIKRFCTLLEEQRYALEALFHDHLVKQTQLFEDNVNRLQRSPLMMDKVDHLLGDEPPTLEGSELLHNLATHPFGVQEEIDGPLQLQDVAKELPVQRMTVATEETRDSSKGLAQRATSMWWCAMHYSMSCFRCLQKYEPDTGTPMQKFVHSAIFRGVVSIIIVVNAMTLGLMTQSRTQAVIAGKQASPMWDALETCFSCFFLLELLLRFAAERMSFLIGANWRWNYFDMLIVATSFVDLLAASAPNVSVSRILRIVQFVRILRVVRVMRFVKSLRLMLIQMLASMWHLVWIAFFLIFILYSSAIFFMSGITEAYPSAGEDMQALMHEYYGSVLETMLSLFMSVSGGDDWANRMQPFRSTMPMYLVGFVIFILAMLFGMLNIFVAAFCECAAEASRRDRDAIVEHELCRAQTIAADIKGFFMEADKDVSGCVSAAELHTHLQNDRMKAFFASLEIDVTQAEDLFFLLDTDDSGSIKLDEFLGGCMRLRGAASSMDVNLLLWESEKLMCQVSEFALQVCTRFEWLENKLGCPPMPRNKSCFVTPRKRRFAQLWTGSKRQLA